jgi:hypothetical protein
MGRVWERREMHMKFWEGKTEEGEMMHKWILMNWNEMLYSGFNWPSAALSWTWS